MIENKTKTNRDSIPECKGRALLPSGNVVGRPKLGMDGYQIRYLDAQFVDLTENTKKEVIPHLKACPDACSCNAVTAVSLSSKGGKWRFRTAVSGAK